MQKRKSLSVAGLLGAMLRVLMIVMVCKTVVTGYLEMEGLRLTNVKASLSKDTKEASQLLQIVENRLREIDRAQIRGGRDLFAGIGISTSLQSYGTDSCDIPIPVSDLSQNADLIREVSDNLSVDPSERARQISAVQVPAPLVMYALCRTKEHALTWLLVIGYLFASVLPALNPSNGKKAE